MKAVVCERWGEPEEVLHVREVPEPQPGPGQVRVRMIASPINPSDLLMVRGEYGRRPPLPATPGFEGVGVVEAGSGLLAATYLAGGAASDAMGGAVALALVLLASLEPAWRHRRLVLALVGAEALVDAAVYLGYLSVGTWRDDPGETYDHRFQHATVIVVEKADHIAALRSNNRNDARTAALVQQRHVEARPHRLEIE